MKWEKRLKTLDKFGITYTADEKFEDVVIDAEASGLYYYDSQEKTYSKIGHRAVSVTLLTLKEYVDRETETLAMVYEDLIDLYVDQQIKDLKCKVMSSMHSNVTKAYKEIARTLVKEEILTVTYIEQNCLTSDKVQTFNGLYLVIK